MIHEDRDFDAKILNIYIVDTTNGDVNVRLPNINSVKENDASYFLNVGINKIIYNSDVLINNSDIYENITQWKSDNIYSDGSNYYVF